MASAVKLATVPTVGQSGAAANPRLEGSPSHAPLREHIDIGGTYSVLTCEHRHGDALPSLSFEHFAKFNEPLASSANTFRCIFSHCTAVSSASVFS